MVSTGEYRNTSTWRKTSSGFNLSTGNPTIYKSKILGNAPLVSYRPLLFGGSKSLPVFLYRKYHVDDNKKGALTEL
jgi:hypothetical protein